MMENKTGISVWTPCTHVVGNDRYPYMVVEAKGNRLIVKPNVIKLGHVMTELRDEPVTIAKRKNGKWYEVGKSAHCQFIMGEHRYYIPQEV